MKTIRATYHITLAWACRITLAALFVPSATLLPAVGDWLTGQMWHHDLMASSAWERR